MSGYTTELIEQLLPAAWDPSYAFGMSNPDAPTLVFRCKTHPKVVEVVTEAGVDVISTCACVEPASRRATIDSKRGGMLFAHLADIKSAWAGAPLTPKMRVAVLLHYGLGWTVGEVALYQGVGHPRVSKRLARAVELLGEHLGGVDSEQPNPED